MNLQTRVDLLIRLGQYILSDSPQWQEAKRKAENANKWFTPLFIETAVSNIATAYLNEARLTAFVEKYAIPSQTANPKKVGLLMAGNIPLVGFHDWACIFLSGHHAVVKTSSKDDVLIRHLTEQLFEWEPSARDYYSFSEMLKGCDAYIATGSNNSARYFDYYFSKYPHIIRRNKTSVGILTGRETESELELLSDDINLYFGLGCRNITKIYVPAGYDFVPLLASFEKYGYFDQHASYKNNYDYQLAIHLINRKYYMTNGTLLLSENESFFSPISQLNYGYYTNIETVKESLLDHPDIQCIAGESFVPFGQAQIPSMSDFADGVDTLKFLLRLG